MTRLRISPVLAVDHYKISHVKQFPPGIQYVASTWIPRESRIEGIEGVIAFGFQAFIKEFLIDDFNENFFLRDVDEVCDEYERIIKNTLGEAASDSSHLPRSPCPGISPHRDPLR